MHIITMLCYLPVVLSIACLLGTALSSTLYWALQDSFFHLGGTVCPQEADSLAKKIVSPTQTKSQEGAVIITDQSHSSGHDIGLGLY